MTTYAKAHTAQKVHAVINNALRNLVLDDLWFLLDHEYQAALLTAYAESSNPHLCRPGLIKKAHATVRDLWLDSEAAMRGSKRDAETRVLDALGSAVLELWCGSNV